MAEDARGGKETGCRGCPLDTDQMAIVRGSYADHDESAIAVLKEDEGCWTRYLGHYPNRRKTPRFSHGECQAFCHYRDKCEEGKMDLEGEEMEKMKDRVPRQMVSLFGTEAVRRMKDKGSEVEK